MDGLASPQPSHEPVSVKTHGVIKHLMNQRLRAHEKAAWMVRASLQP